MIEQDQLDDLELTNQFRENWFFVLRKFIEGNYIYIISALLLLLGATMLRHSSALAISEFARTVQSLLVLQCYELALILTSIAIVRHFKAINDSFVLFAIFLFLVLDPTSFANAFHTMFHKHQSIEMSLWINAGLFVLSALKFGIITHGLRLQISKRGWIAFIFALFCLYISEFPLAQIYIFDESIYYTFVLGSLPVLITVLSPAKSRFSTFDESESFASERIRNRVENMLLILPGVAFLGHYFQTGIIHEYPLTFAHSAPLFLTIAGLLVLYAKRLENNNALLPLIDIILFVTLIVSVPVPSKNIYYEAWTVMETFVPMISVVIFATIFYLRFLLLRENREALYRLGIIFVAGFAYSIYKIGIMDWVVDQVITGADVVSEFLAENFTKLMLFILMGLFVEAFLRKRNLALVVAYNLINWIIVSTLLNSQSAFTFLTILNFILLSTAAILLLRNAQKIVQRTILFMLVFSTTASFLGSVSTETIFFLASGIIMGAILIYQDKDKLVMVMLGIQAAAIIIWSAKTPLSDIPAAWYLIGTGFGLFAAGILITFQKDRIQQYLLPTHSNKE